MTGTLPPLLDSMVDGSTPERNCVRIFMDPMLLYAGKDFVLPNLNIDHIARKKNTRFLVLSLPNNDTMKKSPFAIHKALIGIGGEPKSVKRLRSGDLLIETSSALQTKSIFFVKTFLNSPLTISPQKSLNTSGGVIFELDLLSTPEAEIFDGFSDQGVIQVRRITIKKDNTIIPTKHLILTFNSSKLPTTIKAGYLNCKIRPYIPNPLRCFKCQRFRHSQTSCHGQLTCSICASVGHSSTDCTLKPKCVNCFQSHSSDSKLCSKWKTEKEIQAIITNRNISYVETRKLIAPQLSQTYAQAVKPSTVTTTTQTDENITKIVCQILKLLQPLVSIPKPIMTSKIPVVNKSSTTTQANLLPSTSSVTVTSSSESRPSIPLIDTTPATSNRFSSSSTSQDAKRTSKSRKKRRPKRSITSKIDIQLTPHKPKKSTLLQDTSDEDMIIYDVEEEEESPKILNSVGEIKKFSEEWWQSEAWKREEYSHTLTPTHVRKGRI
ncbi:uncharacterized protein TNCV_1394281 [Trichonephila clavipes]|nr:uncharacterized protein TNCV_1394281 [Trichonephila clavipes]